MSDEEQHHPQEQMLAAMQNIMEELNDPDMSAELQKKLGEQLQFKLGKDPLGDMLSEPSSDSSESDSDDESEDDDDDNEDPYDNIVGSMSNQLPRKLSMSKALRDERIQNSLGNRITHGMQQLVKTKIGSKPGGHMLSKFERETLQKRGITMKKTSCKELMNTTLTRGCYPLSARVWQRAMKKLASKTSNTLNTIDLSGDQYTTDAVLHALLLNKDSLRDVTHVNLMGSIHLTDRGLRWLGQLVESCDNVISISLDACYNITEKGIHYLLSSGRLSKITGLSTNVSFFAWPASLKETAEFQGCPVINAEGTTGLDARRCGQVVIVPAPDLENSCLEYLTDRAVVLSKGSELRHRHEWMLEDWELSLVQLSLEHPICEVLLSTEELTQVVLPISLRASLQDLKTFLTSAIAHFLTREIARRTSLDGYSPSTLCTGTWSKGFMFGGHFDHVEGSFVTTSPAGPQTTLPHFVTKQPFSKTHTFLELELMGPSQSPNQAAKTTTVHAMIFPPLPNITDKVVCSSIMSLAMEMKIGDRLRIGVRYDGNSGAKYYACVNQGEQMSVFSHPEPAVMDAISGTMCPGVAPSESETKMKICNYWKPPQSWLDQNQEQKRLVDDFSVLNHLGMIVDERTGILRYAHQKGSVSTFRGSEAFSKDRPEFSVKILNTGVKGCITIGVAREQCDPVKQPGWLTNSIGYHADDGLIYMSGSGTTPVGEVSDTHCRAGDVMKVVVGGLTDYLTPNMTVPITFYKNDLKVGEVSWLYEVTPQQAGGPVRVVPMIGMHSAGEMVQILDYKVPYDSAEMAPEYCPTDAKFLLPGMCTLSMDGPNLIGNRNIHPVTNDVGTYISANSLTREHPHYEVTLVELLAKKYVGIGLCHQHYIKTAMPGWNMGSIGWHFDNDALYHEEVRGERRKNLTVTNGDVVGCGFHTEHVKFDDKGFPEPDQKLEIYFTRNQKKVMTVEHKYYGGGLHACIGMAAIGAKVYLHNHFAPSPDIEDDSSDLCGVNFLAVAMDTAGITADATMMEVQNMQEQLIPELSQELKSRAEQLQQHAEALSCDEDSLQFSSHQQYAQLVLASNNLAVFVEGIKKRLHILPLNTTTGQGYQAILDHMVQTQQTALLNYPYLYRLPSEVGKVMDTVLAAKDKKILSVQDIWEMCIERKIEPRMMGTCARILKMMHSWGKVVYFEKSEPPLVVTDPGWFIQVIQEIEKRAVDTAGKTVRCLAPNTKLWPDRTLLKSGLKTVDQDKAQTLLEIFLSSNQLIRLPAHRTLPADFKFYLIQPHCLGVKPPTALDKYVSPKLADENIVRIRREYSFPAGIPGYALSAVLATSVNFCQPLLLWKLGMVWHQGAAECVLMMKDGGDPPVLLLEVKGYVPAAKGKMHHSTTQTLERHLWAVFHIQADIIEFVLHQAGVPMMMLTKPKTGPANVSICSSHKWESDFNSGSESEPRINDSPVTVCTLCNSCAERSLSCDYNGLQGDSYRQCPCRTRHQCCWDCGICKHCARALWDMKTFLRPSCELDCTKSTGPGKKPSDLTTGMRGHCEVLTTGKTLDSVIARQVVFTCFSSVAEKPTNICLISADKEVLVHAFPSKPMLCLKDDNYLSVSREAFKKTEALPQLQMNDGDTVQLTIHEPKVRWVKEGTPWLPETAMKIIHYHFHIRRHMVVWQSRGLIRYSRNEDNKLRTARIPVALIAGFQPISAEHPYFEIEIKNRGAHCRTGLGLVPQNYAPEMMPGWGSRSVAYHADDGGIFVENGFPSQRLEKCTEGDKMGCGVDFSELKDGCYNVYFTKNGKKVREIPFLGKDMHLFPAVGMHSLGEVVQLLDTGVWRGGAQEQMQMVAEEGWYEDDLLRIRPNKILRLKKQGPEPESKTASVYLSKHHPAKKKIASQAGVEPLSKWPEQMGGKHGKWDDPLLHRGEIHVIPKEPAVGMCYLYKVMVTDPKRYLAKPNKGVIKNNTPFNVTILTNRALEPDDNIESDKFLVKFVQVPTFTYEEPGDSFWLQAWEGVGKDYFHELKLRCGFAAVSKPLVSAVAQDIDPDFLPDVDDIEPPTSATYCLEVKKNGAVVSHVYMPRLKYHVMLEAPSGSKSKEFPLIASLPRFPSYSYSSQFELGMQVLTGLKSSQLVNLNALKELIQGDLHKDLLSSEEHVSQTIFYVVCTIEEVDPGKTLTVRCDDFPDEGLHGFDSDSKMLHPVTWWQPAAMSSMTVLGQRSDKKVVQPVQLAQANGKRFIKIPGEVHNPAPVHLFTEKQQGSADLSIYDTPLVTLCRHHPELLTVQETALVKLAPTLKSWESDILDGCDLIQIHALLPSPMSQEILTYPSLSDLMNWPALNLHPLCKLHDKWEPSWGGTIYNLIHFMDTEGYRQATGVQDFELMTELMIAWAYGDLLTSGVKLPTFGKIIQGIDDNISRAMVESYMQYIVKVYVTCIGALAQKYGSLLKLPHNPELTQLFQNKPLIGWTPNERGMLDASSDPNGTVDGRCFAHFCTRLHREEFQYTETLDVVGPCAELVTILRWEQGRHDMKVLPADFVEKLSQLEVMNLGRCELPTSMSSMEKLRIIEIAHKGLRELPADLGDCPTLQDLDIQGSSITDLPTSISRCLTLRQLFANHTMLKCLPSEFCRLKNLTVLDVSCNPLLKLPKGFGNLKGLKKLGLSGIPWVDSTHSRFGLTRFAYEEWRDENSKITQIIGERAMDDLFEKCNASRNDVLNQRELADLNAQIFYKLPRLGHSFEEWDEDGGIPLDIFELENLEQLNLQYQNIHFIPADISKLGSLHTLNLSHCMNLESLPSTMGELPNLNTLHLRSCPSLKTPPNEIVSRGTDSVKAYLKRLSRGFTENWRTKLMLVGLGGAGKTSLLRALMSSSHRTKSLTTEDITDGIDIKSWTRPVEESGNEITYSTWDFAGQTVYYNTHQFFLSNRAVYLLLWTTRLGFEHAGLEFWLSSIRCHAPKAPIFVIGTHCDQVPKAELPQAKLKRQYPQIRGFHFVSSITGQGISDLEQAIVEATVEENYMGEKIPQVYLNLEKKILETREETSVLPWERVEKFGMDIGIYDEKDIRRAVQFLHDLGTVQYFDNEFLRGHIVINPQWIVDVMACVVSVKDSPIEDGKFHHENIKRVWKDYPEELHEWLLRLTEAFDLTFPLPDEPTNIVPCLLPCTEPEFEWPALDKDSEYRESMMLYRFAYLPAGLFNRMQVRLFQFSDSETIWKTGSFLKKNKHMALITQLSPTELQVKVQGPRPQNIMFLLHEVMESLVAEAFAGVEYDFMVPCPDCLVKGGAKDAYLFKASLVRRADENNAPFLQCKQHFHAVSMPILQAAMPIEDSNDFDANLAHTMHALEDLRSNLSTDVFISYCDDNVPSAADADQVHPVTLKEDLKKAGFKCWFKENMSDIPIHEKIIGLQDSRVHVVLMSLQYAEDEQCRTLFKYSMDTLNKPLVVVAVGSGLGWQKSDLGLMIGDEDFQFSKKGASFQVFVNMKSKSKYKGELSKLVDFVQSKMAESNERDTVKGDPEVFLSYCWSNSHEAMKIRGAGGSSNTQALGWADPREIKTQLQKRDIACWIDVEQTGKNGLYADISDGIKHSKVVVACVSAEYAHSKNCMMELRFSACTMNKPVILAVVGTGDDWQWGEIGMLEQRSRAPRVNLQTANPQAYDSLCALIKERLDEKSDRGFRAKESARTEVMRSSSVASSVASVNEISFQEEYELAQRKFLRHIAMLAEAMDTVPFPRLFVLDFQEKKGSKNPQGGTYQPHPKAAKFRPASATKKESTGSVNQEQCSLPRRTLQRRDTSSLHQTDMADVMEEDEWMEEEFYIKMLCEHDQGWHATDEALAVPLGTSRQKQDFVQQMAPFLARLYALLHHSGSQLECLASDMGQSFQEYLENHTQEGSSDFVKSYSALRAELIVWDTQHTFGGLSRCHLPTGQIRWLCEEHQKANRVTVLGSTSFTANRQPMVTEDDFIMKEYLELYEQMLDVYRTRKGQRPSSSKARATSARKSSRSAAADGKAKTTSTEHKPPKEKDTQSNEDNAKLKDKTRKVPVPSPRRRPGSASSKPGSAESTSSADRRREAIGKMPGASKKVKAAGQVAQASATWPGQPTSRACTIL